MDIETQLNEAVERDDAEEVLRLLEAGADLGHMVYLPAPEGGSTIGACALHRAAWRGRLRALGVLIARADEIDLQCSDGMTALHYSASWGEPGAVAMLLAAGAEADAMDEELQTPLLCALVGTRPEHGACADMLVAAGALGAAGVEDLGEVS